jgi:hypothetical protein
MQPGRAASDRRAPSTGIDLRGSPPRPGQSPGLEGAPGLTGLSTGVGKRHAWAREPRSTAGGVIMCRFSIAGADRLLPGRKESGTDAETTGPA